MSAQPAGRCGCHWGILFPLPHTTAQHVQWKSCHLSAAVRAPMPALVHGLLCSVSGFLPIGVLSILGCKGVAIVLHPAQAMVYCFCMQVECIQWRYVAITPYHLEVIYDVENKEICLLCALSAAELYPVIVHTQPLGSVHWSCTSAGSHSPACWFVKGANLSERSSVQWGGRQGQVSGLWSRKIIIPALTVPLFCEAFAPCFIFVKKYADLFLPGSIRSDIDSHYCSLHIFWSPSLNLFSLVLGSLFQSLCCLQLHARWHICRMTLSKSKIR